MNGYFQLDIRTDGTYLKVYSPTDGGEAVSYEEVSRYLTYVHAETKNAKILHDVITGESDALECYLTEPLPYEETEMVVVRMSEDRMQAIARFYPPSTNGKLLDDSDIKNVLTQERIRYGIKDEVISEFRAHPNYCMDYVIAEGDPVVQGENSWIEYFFDTQKNATPKLKEDGRVDYHDLNMIARVEAGQLLAKLHVGKPGIPGRTVGDEVVKPQNVKMEKLSYGNKIECSEDKTEIYSTVTGHVCLLNDKIFVSDVYEVPADVDNSTGDIDYEGSIEIRGNVNSGFHVHAGGDIVIGGVVEGAHIEAGGKIIIKGGIHGMSKAVVHSGSTLTARFIENAEAYSDESINADSIIHSNVAALCDIRVLGKKGFIAGGTVHAGVSIQTQTLGSEMGVITMAEVGVDPKKKARSKELADLIRNTKKELEKIEPTIMMVGKKVAEGTVLPPEKMQFLQTLAKQYQALKIDLNNYENEYLQIDNALEASSAANILVKGTVYPGVSVMISDVGKTMAEKRCSCKFVKRSGEIAII